MSFSIYGRLTDNVMMMSSYPDYGYCLMYEDDLFKVCVKVTVNQDVKLTKLQDVYRCLIGTSAQTKRNNRNVSAKL